MKSSQHKSLDMFPGRTDLPAPCVNWWFEDKRIQTLLHFLAEHSKYGQRRLWRAGAGVWECRVERADGGRWLLAMCCPPGSVLGSCPWQPQSQSRVAARTNSIQVARVQITSANSAGKMHVSVDRNQPEA
ncbi:unnamed protein product [Eretmochelys imbricata]